MRRPSGAFGGSGLDPWVKSSLALGRLPAVCLSPEGTKRNQDSESVDEARRQLAPVSINVSVDGSNVSEGPDDGAH